MKDLAEAALSAAQVKGASYADVRLDQHVTQDIVVKNGQLAAVSDDASEGFGVRVIVDGAWGFAGSARLEKREVEEVVDRVLTVLPPGVDGVGGQAQDALPLQPRVGDAVLALGKGI